MPRTGRQTHPLHPLARALRSTSFSLLLLGSLASSLTLADTNQTRHYQIPAGSLSSALSEFASQAGITLSIEPVLVEGKNSMGLKADTDIDSGLNQLLQGSGLKAVKADDGTFSLQKAAEVGRLKTVKVSSNALGDTTEGTRSYTTGNMNSATKLNLSIRETPQSVSVVTRQQMEDQNLTTLANVLERTVGISLGQGETDRANVTVRGFDVHDYRIDGMPTTVVGMHDEHMNADMASYDRIEITRGATGLLSGNGDPSASINMIRKRPNREFQASVFGSVGRWNAYRTEVDVSGALTQGGAVRGRAVGAWRDTDSHVDHYNNQRGLIYGVLDIDLTANTLLTTGVQFRRSETDGASFGQPVPMFYSNGDTTNFPRSTTSAGDWTFLNSDTTNVFASLEHNFADNWQANVRVERQELEAKNQLVYLYGFPNRETGEGVSTLFRSYDSDGTQENADLYLTGGFNLFDRAHELVLGWNYSDQVYDQKYHLLLSSEPLDNYYDWNNYPAPVFGEDYDRKEDYSTRQDGFYVATRWQLADPLKLILGARQSNLRSGGFTYVEDELTPYGGLVYNFAEHFTAYASYTEIFRFNGARNYDDKLLDPVTGTNYEAGIKGEFNEAKLNFSAAVFRIKQDNLPEYIGVNETTGKEFYRAVEGATVEGFELEISGEPVANWNLSGGFTRALAKDATGTTIMTQEPDSLLRLTASHSFQQKLEGLRVGAHMTWQEDIYMKEVGPEGEDAVQKAYGLVHLFSSYQVNKQLHLQANLNNIFDKTYYKGFYNYGYYGEPRNLTLSAKYSF
ncbi:MAG: TonB-dependent siderophore receptor [Cellvibrio sp.]|uniref:TonB-dependent siderophore receptor n=1 Tax=Cellvibrio sp. TaxID=1965322 RepID=UPI0031A61B97